MALKLKIDPKKDFKDKFNNNLEFMNLEVMADCIGMFSKFRAVYAEVIKWTKDITLN